MLRSVSRCNKGFMSILAAYQITLKCRYPTWERLYLSLTLQRKHIFLQIFSTKIAFCIHYKDNILCYIRTNMYHFKLYYLGNL